MKLSCFNTSMAHNQAQAYIYDMTLRCNAQCKRELEKVDQTQTPRYVSRFEHTALRLRLHTEGFPLTRPHRTSHTGNLH